MPEARAPHPLIGRDAELAALAGLVPSRGASRPRLGLVLGEAGIGKSRLVEALLAGPACRGVTVFAGRCLVDDLAIPLAPWADALRQRIAVSGGQSRLVLGPQCPQLAALLPELYGACPPPASLTALEPEQAQRVVLEAIVAVLVRESSRQPVVVALEDLQWADSTTIVLIGLLGRRLAGRPIAIIGTARPDESTTRLLAASRSWESAAEIVSLEPLDLSSARQLVASLAPGWSRGEAADVVRRAAGNPLFTEELVRARERERPDRSDSAQPVPAAIAELLLGRVDALDPEARLIAEVAAVADGDVETAVLTAGSDLPGERVDDGVAILVQAGILERVPRPTGMPAWRFHHDLAREALYTNIAPSRRRLLHHRVATALAMRFLASHANDDVVVADSGSTGPTAAPAAAGARPHSRSPADPATLARHYHAAGDWPLALESATEAGDAASRLHATAEALAHHRRALDAALAMGATARAAGLHLRVGEGLQLLGDYEAAERQFSAARRTADLAGDVVTAQGAVSGLATLAARRDYAAAESLSREALAMAAGAADPPMEARARNRLANVLANRLRFGEARELHEAALLGYRSAGDAWGEADTLDLMAMTSYLAGDLTNARDAFGAAAAGFERLDDQARLASALASGRLYLAVLDAACPAVASPEDGAADAARAVAICREIGWRAGEAYALAALASDELGMGRPGEARGHVEEALAAAREIDHRQWILLATYVRGLIDVATGGPDAALTAFREALDLARGIASAQWTARLEAWVARGEARAGDATAIERLRRLAPAEGSGATSLGERTAALHVAEALVAVGDSAGALAALRALDAGGADVAGAPAVLLIRGRAQATGGAVDEARATLDTAARIVDRMGPRPLAWQIAAASASLAESAAGAGMASGRHLAMSSSGRAASSRARAALLELAAACTEQDRDRLLRQPDARPFVGPSGRRRTAAGAGPGGLTGRELEVARAVARGLRNKEIGAALGIAAKTVEMHVATCLAKLELQSRAALAAWVVAGHREGPQGSAASPPDWGSGGPRPGA